ncbi:MAG TPA: hypothetical protein VF679_03400 [Pedobacter sp.]
MLAFIFSVSACSSDNSNINSTLGIAGMIKVSDMSHDATIPFLLSKGYILESSDVIYKQRVTFMNLKQNAITAEIVKTQWVDNGRINDMVHLDLRPVTLDKTIYTELSKLGFKLKESHRGNMESFGFMVKIYIQLQFSGSVAKICLYL